MHKRKPKGGVKERNKVTTMLIVWSFQEFSMN